MQIYTNFESNSQQEGTKNEQIEGCFRCKFTQILKAIHNGSREDAELHMVVFDANLHKF